MREINREVVRMVNQDLVRVHELNNKANNISKKSHSQLNQMELSHLS